MLNISPAWQCGCCCLPGFSVEAIFQAAYRQICMFFIVHGLTDELLNKRQTIKREQNKVNISDRLCYNKLPQNCYFFQRTGKTTACRFIFRESKELAAAFEKQSLRRTQTDFDSLLKTCAASPVLQTVLFNEIKLL